MSTDQPFDMGRHLRKKFFTGLLILLPLFITLWLLSALFRLVDGTITPWVQRILGVTGVEVFTHPGFIEYLIPLVGVVITVGLIYLTGVLSTNVFGVRILKAFDRLMLRIPGVRAVYGGTRQLVEAFSPKGKGSFTEVVLVEYPRMGCYTLGFVTRDAVPDLVPGQSEALAAVFLPTTPNPTSGWIVFIPHRELVRLPLSVEEGVKLVVSGGIVMPEAWGVERKLPAHSPQPVQR
jgi:uncharacterized membrane protein